MDREIMTTSEVRKALKVSKGTLTKLVKAKILNPIVFGDTYRFRDVEVKHIMENGYEFKK